MTRTDGEASRSGSTPGDEAPGELAQQSTSHEAAPGESGQGGAAPGTAAPGTTAPGRSGVGRRGLLGVAGASLLAGGLFGYTGARAVEPAAPPAEDPLARSHPLRGEHQAGILTPAQDYLFTAAFDVAADSLDELRELMETWCIASEQMCAGELVGGEPVANPHAVPRDTGEAWGYPASSLTITVGVGASLFQTAAGEDRFGLSPRLTPVLEAGMPKFAGEALRSAQSGGDLVVQACADDAQIAMHAIRNLTRLAFGTAALRWTQIGYGRTSSTSTAQETPRNLFGFKDGTSNLKAEDDPAVLAAHLWVGAEDEGGDWLSGGSYLTLRKIRMHLEVWDRLQRGKQEDIIGRDKQFGAPLSLTDAKDAADEFTDPDFAANTDGAPRIPADAHIRQVSPENNNGARMLRRGYNYTDGSDSLGRLDGGLFFEAFVRDPRTGFYPVLTAMTSHDALDEYVQHVGSGLFAILPGVAEGDTMFGQRLFGRPGTAQ